jgi:hypothetical protein
LYDLQILLTKFEDEPKFGRDKSEGKFGHCVLWRIISSENNDNNVTSQRDLVAPVSYSLEASATTKKRKECKWR